MKAPEATAGSQPPPGPSFQFSLKTMFLATTGVAVGESLLFTAPRAVNLIAGTCFLVLLPAVLTVVLVYGRGYQRTFCIGALFPAYIGFQSSLGAQAPRVILYGLSRGSRMFDKDFSPGVFVAVVYAVSMLFGLVAVFVRRRVEKSQST